VIENKLTIKNRVIQYLNFKGVSKYQFYKETGLSNGMLDKPGAIGSDKCEIIYSQYPDINLEWFLSGKGEMLIDMVSDKDPLILRIIRITQEFPLDYKKFCEKIGRNYKNKGSFHNPFSMAEIAGIIKLFPQVDPVWIITGESKYPLSPNNGVALIVKNENELVSALQDKIGKLNLNIEHMSNIIKSKNIELDGKALLIDSNNKLINDLINRNESIKDDTNESV